MIRGFSPDQPRDPDGKWTGGGFSPTLPAVIAGADFSVGGAQGRLDARPGDKVGLSLAGASVEMRRPEHSGSEGGTNALQEALHADLGVTDIAGPDGATIMRVSHGELAGEDGSKFDAYVEFTGQGVKVALTEDEASELRRHVVRVAAASRVDVESGPVDTYLNGKLFGIRTQIGDSEPRTMEFDAKSWRKLSDAHNTVHEGIDESGDYGPEMAKITELTVKTNAGRVIVSRSGTDAQYGADDKNLRISISSVDRDDWFVTHAGDDHAFFAALNRLEENANELGFYAQSAAPAAQTRQRSGAPTRSHGGAAMTTTPREAAVTRARAQIDAERHRRSGARGHDRAARFNRQFHVRAQLRAAGDNATTLDGYASITGEPYSVRDWLGEYDETIERGAFAKTLRERDDVRLLLNHDGMPLARTSAGTMTLGEDDNGLHVVAELDRRSTLTNDVAVAMERGDLTEMSFAFSVTRQEWDGDYTQRWIKEVKLFDVSVVTYPANPATTVGLRTADLDNVTDDELREIVARAQRRLAPAIDSTLAMDALRLAMSLPD